MDKIKIGIISEHHKNDGGVVATLLEKYFPEKGDYEQLSTGFKGDEINTPKCFRAIKAKCTEYEPDIIIVVRDLDSDSKQSIRTEYFEKCTKQIPMEQQIHLLFIYEIEALALTDWQTTQDVLEWKDKKQKMLKSVKAKTKDAKGFVAKYFEYSEGDMKKLAEYFDLNQLKNYPVWSDFITEMTQKFNF